MTREEKLREIKTRLQSTGEPFAMILVHDGLADVYAETGTNIVIWDEDNEAATEEGETYDPDMTLTRVAWDAIVEKGDLF